MQALLAGGALQLQHYFAAKADLFVGNDDGIPSEATLLALLALGSLALTKRAHQIDWRSRNPFLLK
jgi:hypothetical protein